MENEIKKIEMEGTITKAKSLENVDLNGLAYDKESGIISRIKKKKGAFGPVMGIGADGYRRIHVNGVTYKQHRLAFLFIGINPDGYEVDHLNGDRLDNRIKNLRLVGRSQNQLNSKRNRGSNTPYVDYDKKAKRWRVQKQINGKMRFLGYYKTKEQAIVCVKENDLFSIKR